MLNQIIKKKKNNSFNVKILDHFRWKNTSPEKYIFWISKEKSNQISFPTLFFFGFLSPNKGKTVIYDEIQDKNPLLYNKFGIFDWECFWLASGWLRSWHPFIHPCNLMLKKPIGNFFHLCFFAELRGFNEF